MGSYTCPFWPLFPVVIQVLKHLECITQHRDRSLLELGVVSALFEMLGPSDVNLYHLVYSDNDVAVERVVHVSGGHVQFTDVDMHGALDSMDIESRADMLAAIHELAWVCDEQEGGGCVYCVPVGGDERPLAVLELRAERPLTEDQIELAEGFLKLYRNYLNLLDYSERDMLTGLLNRKTFDERLSKVLISMAGYLPESMEIIQSGQEVQASPQIERRQSHNQDPYWLAVLDIDHFKDINDRFGHLYGDEVLILLANLMRRCFRRQDMLFRFGGEEFVVVMRARDEAQVMQTLERLRQTVESYPFPQVGRVTVSAGFSRIQISETTSDTIGFADDALYYAKRNGRNRVCSYHALVAAGELKASHCELHSDIELF